MAEQEVIKKITEILSFLYLESDSNKLDQDKVFKTVCEFEEKIRTCLKQDHEIIEFFKKKKNFPKISDLKTFTKSKLKSKLSTTKRADIEDELVQLCLEKNFDAIELEKKLHGESTSKKKLSKKVENQALHWFKLTEELLIKDLNNQKKYPSEAILKEAAITLLTSKQRKLKTRKSIVSAIISSVKKEKSTMLIGS